jgi:hypothetical protein
MSVQIILKYGNGKPADGQLVQGEIGVDITGKSLWTYNGTTNIQLSGGSIDLGQLPDVDIGGGNFISIEELAVLVGKNEADIADLEGRVTVNEGDISANAGAIAGNTSEIGKLDVRVKAVEDWQVAHEAAFANLLLRIDGIEGDIDGNTAAHEANKDQIDLLWKEVGLIEGGLSFAGTYNASTNKVASVSSYAATLGVTEGSTLNDNTGQDQTGLYFIVTTPGTLNNTGGDGSDDLKEAYRGDWLICDGSKYLLANYQMETVLFEQIDGDPYANDALKAALDEKISRNNDTIEGGNYTTTP